MADEVLYEKQGAIGWITLNRPDQLNAINDRIRQLLPECVLTAERDAEVRVIVVRGAGERAFCAGADVKEFAPVDSAAAYRQARVHRTWIRPFDDALKPIVASIHGHCLGGGLEIALACDIRIASRGARFGFPETGLGIIPGVGGSQRILRLAGAALAMDLLLTGERITAERALSIGVITRLVEDEALAAQTTELAERIAAKAPLATAFAKELVRTGADLPHEAARRKEVDLLALLLDTEDRLEAAQAFREKRPPRFVGR
ncbi:MAG: enoyl-CoA hydratase/isomerase family protein [Lautropia sp.]